MHSSTSEPTADRSATSFRTRHVSTYTELARNVRESGLLKRRYGFYWSMIIGLLAAFAGIWVAFAFMGNSWFQLILAAALAVVLAQFGFLGHDSAHRQVFASNRWNDWAARVISGLFVGLGHGWWLGKHNRHHANPNKEGADPDIAPGFLAFTPAVAAGKRGLAARVVPRQGYVFFPLLLLEGLHLHVSSIRTIFGRQPVKHRWWDAGLVSTRLGGYITVLLIFLPPGKAAAFFGVQMAVFGLLLGGSFAPNHIGMPIVPPDLKIDFLRRQVLMSRNIRGGLMVDVALGGLNYQIEHHLFPNMPRPNLRRVKAMVRDHCAVHDIPYHETTLAGAYASVLRYLNKVGRGGFDAYHCPLAAQYRA